MYLKTVASFSHVDGEKKSAGAVAQELHLALLNSYHLWPIIKSEFTLMQSTDGWSQIWSCGHPSCVFSRESAVTQISLTPLLTRWCRLIHAATFCTFLSWSGLWQAGWCFSLHAVPLGERPGKVCHRMMEVVPTEKGVRRDTHIFYWFCISVWMVNFKKTI